MDRETFCYVTYSDETAELFEVGFMPYSKKNEAWASFALEIKQLVQYKDMTSDEKKLYTEALAHLGHKKEDKPAKGTLGGLENDKLKYSTAGDSPAFLGFIFSVSGFGTAGQDALQWF